MKSINPTKSEIDREWIGVSKKRLDELRTGRVKGVPGDEVFDRIWKRFGFDFSLGRRRPLKA